MEWPIINGFNSPLKITQDWLPNLTIQLGMARTARFDRCRTCHVGNRPRQRRKRSRFSRSAIRASATFPSGSKKQVPQPYATHPDPDLYLTAASPHGLQKFGCTICHDGQGSGTSFSDASHTANDPHQYEVWHAGHHYASNHFWEYPMQPERLRESTCIKCHHPSSSWGYTPSSGRALPNSSRLQPDQGVRLLRLPRDSGVRRPAPIGPDLRLEPSTEAEAARSPPIRRKSPGPCGRSARRCGHIRIRRPSEFVSYWVEDPQRFRPTTKMPKFFHLTNMEDPTGQRLQPVELAGITQYLLRQVRAVRSRA